MFEYEVDEKKISLFNSTLHTPRTLSNTQRSNTGTSFMMYESIQLETIPIYIYDDREWLPYRDLKWDEFSVVISKENIDKLPSVRSVDFYKKKSLKSLNVTTRTRRFSGTQT